MSIITSFRAGLAFFTRIPVGSAPLPPTLSGVVAWLPAVGLLVGFLPAVWVNRRITRSQKPEFVILRHQA